MTFPQCCQGNFHDSHRLMLVLCFPFDIDLGSGRELWLYDLESDSFKQQKESSPFGVWLMHQSQDGR
jgi:hypothetical protein